MMILKEKDKKNKRKISRAGLIKEEWRDITGFENIYQVSSEGNVRSVDRKVMHIKKTHCVHQLVASMFLDSVPGCEFVNHKDTIKTNNKASNIEYVTFRENVTHALKASSSLFVGVSLDAGLWRASININNKKIRLGTFKNEEDAGNAYINALIKYGIKNRYSKKIIQNAD